MYKVWQSDRGLVFSPMALRSSVNLIGFRKCHIISRHVGGWVRVFWPHNSSFYALHSNSTFTQLTHQHPVTDAVRWNVTRRGRVHRLHAGQLLLDTTHSRERLHHHCGGRREEQYRRRRSGRAAGRHGDRRYVTQHQWGGQCVPAQTQVSSRLVVTRLRLQSLLRLSTGRRSWLRQLYLQFPLFLIVSFVCCCFVVVAHAGVGMAANVNITALVNIKSRHGSIQLCTLSFYNTLILIVYIL